MYKRIAPIALLLAFNANAVEVRPEINGTFELADIQAYMAGTANSEYQFGGSNNQGGSVTTTPTPAVPDEVNEGLVWWTDGSTACAKNEYMTIKDIRIAESAGSGIRAGKFSCNIVFQNLEIHYAGVGGIELPYGGEQIHILSNDVYSTVHCPRWHVNVNDSNAPVTCTADYPPSVFAAGYNKYVTIEDNDIWQTHGEGIGYYRNQWAIIAFNRVRDTRKSAIYTESSSDVDIFSNITWDSNSTDETFTFTNGRSPEFDFETEACINTAIEFDQDVKRNAVDVYIRNNICHADGQRGIRVLPLGNFATDYGTEADIFHNLVINATWDLDADNQEDDTGKNVRLVMRNNITHCESGLGCTAANILTTSPASWWGTVAFSDNKWNIAPSDSGYSSSGDLTGKPNLARDADTWDKSNWTFATGPTLSDAILQAGDSGLNAGFNLTTGTIDVDHGLFDYTPSVLFTPTEANIEKPAAYDFDGTTRSTTPNLGPDETN